jgi:hypothetical protein
MSSAAHCITSKKESAVVYVNGKIVPEIYDVKERYKPFRMK